MGTKKFLGVLAVWVCGISLVTAQSRVARPASPMVIVCTVEATESNRDNYSQIVVSSKSNGGSSEIKTKYKDLGDEVTVGEELFDCGNLPGYHYELKALLEQAREQALLLAQELAKQEKLFKTLVTTAHRASGSVTADELEIASRNVLKARHELRAAQQNVLVMEGRSTPYNPIAWISGKVVWVNQEYYRTGFQISDNVSTRSLVLMKVADLSRMRASVVVKPEQARAFKSVQVSPVSGDEDLKVLESGKYRDQDGQWRIFVEFESAGLLDYLDLVQVTIQLK